MFFRNLTMFRFPRVDTSLFPLKDALAECKLKPVGPLEMSSRGFVSPYGRGDDRLVVGIGHHLWVSIGGEDRILPPAVVNELLAKKLDEIEEKEGRRPGSRTRKRLKEDLLVELIPRAFVSPCRTDAILDMERGLVYVDSSSRRNGEGIVSELRRALGSFPALPLNAESAPRSVLTGWLAGEPMPEGWALGEECELKDALANGAVVKLQHQELESEEVDKHLEAGKQCTRLEVIVEERISCVLSEDLVVRKLRFLEGSVGDLESTEREDLQAELDARCALMVGELSRLFDSLETIFRLSRADEGHVVPKGADIARSGTVTISVSSNGRVTDSVTMAAGEFKDAGDAFALYQQAVGIVRENGKCSISHLQRRLKIGYNRAARLIEAMEERGVVSAPDRTGARTLLSAGAR